MDSNSSNISVFFPCYNDSRTIASMITAAFNTLGTLTKDSEVIVIDDGSTDGSRSILEGIQNKHENLRLIFHDVNKCYGAALRSGFEAATKDFVFYTDGDYQYDVRELTRMVPLMNDGVDIVNGFKVKRKDSFHRIITGHIYNYLVKLMFGIKIKDPDCNFRLIRRYVLEQVSLECDSGAIGVEMLKKFQDAGFTIAEVQVSHYFRPFGTSQASSFRHIFQVGKDLIKPWWTLVLFKMHKTPPATSTGESTNDESSE